MMLLKNPIQAKHISMASKRTTDTVPLKRPAHDRPLVAKLAIEKTFEPERWTGNEFFEYQDGIQPPLNSYRFSTSSSGRSSSDSESTEQPNDRRRSKYLKKYKKQGEKELNLIIQTTEHFRKFLQLRFYVQLLKKGAFLWLFDNTVSI